MALANREQPCLRDVPRNGTLLIGRDTCAYTTSRSLPPLPLQPLPRPPLPLSLLARAPMARARLGRPVPASPSSQLSRCCISGLALHHSHSPPHVNNPPPRAPLSNSPTAVAMRQAAATGSYSSPNTSIHTVLNSTSPARTPNPSTGLPYPLPLNTSALAIAPSSNPSHAFSTHAAAQAVLRLGAKPEGLVLPAHVITPSVGR